MKLATLRDGTRDGRLVVVSRDLSRAVEATAVAPRLQDGLDRWGNLAPRLQELAAALESERAPGTFEFDPGQAMAPLPRAHHWADGSAYVNHVELVRKARGVEMPPSFWTDPLVYQGGSDDLLGPRDDVPVASEEFGIDLEAEVAVITDDVPMGTTPAEARGHILLLMLVKDVAAQLDTGRAGQGVRVLPVQAGDPVLARRRDTRRARRGWDGARVHRPLVSHVNGRCSGSRTPART